MILDATLTKQLEQYFTMLEEDVVITASLDESDSSKKLAGFIDEVMALSPKITLQKASLKRTPSFSLSSVHLPVEHIIFSGMPLGHEFNSFILAILQVSGRAPKISDALKAQIQAVQTDLNFETYVSLTCQKCPDVVQALNIMSLLNPHIKHTMVEGGTFKSEVEEKEILTVPSIYLNGEYLANGRQSIEELLALSGEAQTVDLGSQKPFDVLIIGGGPAAGASAIYAARKGIRTGIVCDNFGGQPTQTLGIENTIVTPYIEGEQLMRTIEEQLTTLKVEIIKGQLATEIKKADFVEVTLKNGQQLQSKTVIVATGAKWRNIGVPGEKEFETKGVCYCPHCDGPLFSGKDVAVVGGGNSGIEAAIDLAGIVKHVTVLEFMPELKADEVLQKKLATLKNVTVLTNVATNSINGTSKVESLTYTPRDSNEAKTINLAGVFVQIGLVPNSSWLKDTLAMDQRGYIQVNSAGETNIPAVYAAGDVTDCLYKQIVISLGSGATAALSAFDYLMRQ